MAAPIDDPNVQSTVGKLIGGALVVGGSAWAVIRMYLANRRTDSVADAQAAVQVDSFQAYSSTITMLNQTVAQLRQEYETASKKWREDMDTLDQRLKDVSIQVDAAIARARTAEDAAEKLRNQLREAKLEPIV